MDSRRDGEGARALSLALARPSNKKQIGSPPSPGPAQPALKRVSLEESLAIFEVVSSMVARGRGGQLQQQ